MMQSLWTAGLACVVMSSSISLSASAEAQRPAAGTIAVDAVGLRQRLAQQRGRVIVLNMWATWCPPCVHEFPDLVKLDRAYQKRGVVVIGLAMDDPQTARQTVPPFVARQRAAFPVYLLKPGDPQSVVRVVDPYWSGAVPMTYIFDKAGRLRTRLTGARTLEGFEMAIKPLLAEK
jgi:thiol-disulfide isomerase/thioredoxin